MEAWVLTDAFEGGVAEVCYFGVGIFVEDCGLDFIEEEDEFFGDYVLY